MEPRSLISMEYEPADNGGAAGHLYGLGGGLFASAAGAACAGAPAATAAAETEAAGGP